MHVININAHGNDVLSSTVHSERDREREREYSVCYTYVYCRNTDYS